MAQSKNLATSSSLKFNSQGDFRRTLRDRADRYFQESGLDERDQPAMYLKTLMIFTWFVLSYVVLVFVPVPLWGKILAAVSIGFAGAGVGFSIMHDAGHGAYSKNKKINSLVFFSLDLLGGSSYLWNVKHNIIHHSFANVEGHDDDIDMGFLGRLAPEQKRYSFHRFQHIYLWFLYGMMVLKWNFYDDFNKLLRGKIGAREIPPMKKKDLAVFILGKVLFLTYVVIIPTLIYGIGLVFLFYMIATFVKGVVMATVFQLAHCVEEADWPLPDETNRMEHDWATHQVMTTVNFAPKSFFINWYVGGLNYQIEHHLFPRISHIHYPALSKIVAETCEEFGLPYRVQPTFWGGVRSHFRWVRRLGRPTQDQLTPLPG